MTTRLYSSPDIKTVASRPVKAKATQFLYRESSEETRRHIRQIGACLDVTLKCASDQGALFVHLEIDQYHSPIVNHTDWIVVDSFGKVSVIKDSEFKIYYEPESRGTVMEKIKDTALTLFLLVVGGFYLWAMFAYATGNTR